MMAWRAAKHEASGCPQSVARSAANVKRSRQRQHNGGRLAYNGRGHGGEKRTALSCINAGGSVSRWAWTAAIGGASGSKRQKINNLKNGGAKMHGNIIMRNTAMKSMK